MGCKLLSMIPVARFAYGLSKCCRLEILATDGYGLASAPPECGKVSLCTLYFAILELCSHNEVQGLGVRDVWVSTM